MRKILTLVLFFYSMISPAQVPDLKDVRILYEQAATDEVSCNRLIKELNDSHPGTDPVRYGYKGTATMMKANYAFNPFKKLSYFNQGKDLLLEAIESDPGNVELCFLRFAAQTNTPKMLGYRGEIEVDKKIVLNQLNKIKEKDLKEMIVSFLKKSPYLNEEEKKKMNITL